MMEPRIENSFSNTTKPSHNLLCQDNLLSCEEIIAESGFLAATDDQISIDKMLVVQKTMVLKERTLLSGIQNEINFDQLPRFQSTVSSQIGNLIDDMEFSSQTSFMELCSQESVEKMDACSQESIASRMDLGSQENGLKVKDCVPISSRRPEINAVSAEIHKPNLKRKHSLISN